MGGCYKSLTRGRLAEGVGFEPTVSFPTSVFKTDAIDHSATPPIYQAGAFGLLTRRSGEGFYAWIHANGKRTWRSPGAVCVHGIGMNLAAAPLPNGTGRPLDLPESDQADQGRDQPMVEGCPACLDGASCLIEWVRPGWSPIEG
jgi:hypothetical protein